MFQSLPFGASYSLGCSENNAAGMLWSATASIPAVPYLSDPGDAGIQFKQIVSVYRKRLNNGRMECWTSRNPQSDPQTGWQLDATDPFHSGQYAIPSFVQGTTITAQEFDSPATPLDRNNAQVPTFEREAVFVDDFFETYVQYYTGSPQASEFVRLLHVADASCPADRFDCGVDRLVWRWGGQVNYDASIPITRYRETASSTSIGNIFPSRTGTIRAYSGIAQSNVYSLCQGAANVTNPIDGIRFFTQQLYLDVLHRNPDEIGWNNWTTTIASCGFDGACIYNMRIHTARGFLESSENFANNPLLTSPDNHIRNREYVRLCYVSFLGRPPDETGWNNWTDYLDSNPDGYNHVVGGFICSWEYRGRFGTP
jgi:hypothetical protein